MAGYINTVYGIDENVDRVLADAQGMSRVVQAEVCLAEWTEHRESRRALILT
eukprot:jgi/Antlo1/1044/1102